MSVKGEDIDWDHIRWGSFTEQFKRYNSTHTKKMKDLTAFAKMILKAPKSKYHERTRKRANFYLNVLKKDKPKEKHVTVTQKQNVVVNINHPKPKRSKPRKVAPRVVGGIGGGQGQTFIQTSAPVPVRTNSEQIPLVIPQRPAQKIKQEVEAVLEAVPEVPKAVRYKTAFDEWKKPEPLYSPPFVPTKAEKARFPLPSAFVPSPPSTYMAAGGSATPPPKQRGRPTQYTAEESRERQRLSKQQSYQRQKLRKQREKEENQLSGATSAIDRSAILRRERTTHLGNYFDHADTDTTSKHMSDGDGDY